MSKVNSKVKNAASVALNGMSWIAQILIAAGEPAYYNAKVAEILNDPTMSETYKWSRIQDIVREAAAEVAAKGI